MQTKNPFFDDMAKLAGGAAGMMHDMRTEMEGAMRAWLGRQLDGLDLVTREEFETVKDMAVKAREENVALRAELDALTAAASKGGDSGDE